MKSSSFEIGIYQAVTTVNIRREPRVIEQYKDKVYYSNKKGELRLGMQRMVLDFVTDDSNVTWGRISEPDATGNSEWVCIQGLNKTYMQKVVSTAATEVSIEMRLSKLETWAKTQGYK